MICVIVDVYMLGSGVGLPYELRFFQEMAFLYA